MRRLIYHPEVKPELGSALAYYEEQQEGLSSRLLQDFELAITDIVANPEAWPQFDDDIYRRHQLSHFPFAVIYRILPDSTIRVIAVMHLHREPGYWRNRK